LSEALLRDLRVTEAASALIEVGKRSAARLAPTRRSMLHFVLDGCAHLKTAATAELLRAGDCALLLYGDRHTIGDSPCNAVTEISIPVDSPAPDVPGTIAVGRGSACCLVLSSALELAYMPTSAFATRAAPECWVMHKGAHENSVRVPELEPEHVLRACRGPGATAFTTVLASLLLVGMLRDTYEKLWHEQEVEVRSPNARRVAAAVRQIHAHPARNWTVASLARQVGLSRSIFAEVFRTHMRSTPLSYLTEVRMKRAAELLEVESMALSEVAGRVGYPLEGSFARVFKQYFGVSPKSFAARRRP
jgi:AraC-like DNA-binding protein